MLCSMCDLFPPDIESQTAKVGWSGEARDPSPSPKLCPVPQSVGGEAALVHPDWTMSDEVRTRFQAFLVCWSLAFFNRKRRKRLSVGVIYHVNDKDDLFPGLCALSSLHYAEVEGVASFSLLRLSTLLKLITHVIIYNYHHSTKLYRKISRVCCRLYCYECVSSFHAHCHCLVIMLKWKESLVSGW